MRLSKDDVMFGICTLLAIIVAALVINSDHPRGTIDPASTRPGVRDEP